MMNNWLVLLITFAPWPMVHAQLDTTMCTQNKSISTGPTLPQLPAHYFTMRVEANLVDKNMTVDVHKWHDGFGNRGAANIWYSSVPISYIYSYNTKEQFTFEEMADGQYQCRVQALDSVQQPYMHGTDSVNTSHIYTTATALSFAGGLEEHYVGRSRVRGVVTDMWRSCVYWPQYLNATMSVLWHFTVQEGWDTVLGLSQQPVRCEVRGRIHSGHSPKDFHHVYEVTEFYEYLDGGPTVFETPAGTVCPGRKERKPVPTLPQAFSYSAELVHVEEHSTQFIKKAYDAPLQLAMMELVSTAPSHSKLRIIDDFNTGASYTVDRVRGNCTMGTIDPVGFDAISTSTGLRMRNSHEFFFGDSNDYSYEGIRSLRQLNTEVWVGKKWWPPNNPTNSTWEYYFITPEWQENAGFAGTSSIPVSIHVTIDRQQAHQVYNLYDFCDDDPRIWDYDITSCFDDSEQFRVLNLHFPATTTQLHIVSTNQGLFRRAFLNSVQSLVSISPVRLNNMQLQFRQGEVMVVVVVVEAVRVASGGVRFPLAELPLAVVVTRLQEAALTHRLVVSVHTTSGSVSLVAAPVIGGVSQSTASTRVSETKPSSPTLAVISEPSSQGGGSIFACPPQSAGYTPGDVSGVTMGTAFGCYMMVLVTVSVWMRWRGSAPVYRRDGLEMS